MHLEPAEERILEIIWNHAALDMHHTMWGKTIDELPGTYKALIDANMIEHRLDTQMSGMSIWSFHLTAKGMLVAKSLFPHPKDV